MELLTLPFFETNFAIGYTGEGTRKADDAQSHPSKREGEEKEEIKQAEVWREGLETVNW